jgi:glutamine amidotransferase
MTDVTIIDNGGANIASLRFALDRLGAASSVTADADEIRRAPRVILPGVGAAADAMERLRASGLASVIPQLQQPVLGICLGMQLLFSSSEEGETGCLGIIPSRVARFADRRGFPVPHMGWNQVRARAASPLLQGVEDGAYAYFVHSFRAPVGPWTEATTDYGGEFSALVRQGNFMGVQFHPERSSQAGHRMLANFLTTGLVCN